MLKYIIVFFCFWHHGSLLAQSKEECDCQLHGEVIDVVSKEPIVGAVILLKGTTRGTSTDAKGHYHFDKLCHGKQIIVCRIVGYKETQLEINLSHNEDFEHDFKLNEDESHLDHIEIRAEKIENQTQSKLSLVNAALDQTRGQTLGEALKQITGMTALQSGSSIVKPVIHGMHSNRILILNNGIRQEGQQWGSEHAPEVDPFVAKKISVLKGAAGVRYGSDAIAGVIMLEPEALPDSNSFAGEMNSIFFSNGRQTVNSGILEKGFSFGKNKSQAHSIGLRVQGTIKRGGDVSTPSYRLINTGVQEFNYSLSANYKHREWLSEVYFSQFNSKIGVFAGSHIGNVTDLVSAIAQSKPLEVYTPKTFSYRIDRPFQDLQHNLLKIVNTKNTVLGKFSLTLGKQYDFRREVDVLRGDKNLVQQFELNTYTGELLLEHKPLFKIMTGSLGVAMLDQTNLTTGTLKIPRSSTVLIPNFQNSTQGIFLIERIVKRKWLAEAGLRFDTRRLKVYRIPRGQQNILSDTKNNQNITATVGTQFYPGSHLSVMTNVSSAWRAASVNELYSDGVHHGAGSFERGDENLVPELALNSSFTINYSKDWIESELHLYSNLIENFIFLTPTGRPVLTIRGAFPEFFYTQTKAVFQGIDLSFNLKLNKNIQFNTRVAYLNAQDISNDQPLILIPANRIENTLKYEKGKGFLSVNYQFVATQKRVPTKSIFKEIPTSDIVFDKYGGDYAAPPSSYQLWGASLGYHFALHKKQPLDLSLSGTNLLNTKYRDYLNRFRYFADEIGRNLILRAKYRF